MGLERYAFELLSWLERNRGRKAALRDMADELCVSGARLTAEADKLEAEGLLTRGEGAPIITEAGLAALEPYRVKRAIVLAAGFGSRMMPATADRPKPLVTVNGVRIIETLLDALTGAGVEDITLVRGYKKERFDELLEKYPGLHLVDNDIYDSTNNISSIMKVLDRLEGGVWLCEADLYITDPAVIPRYQYASNILGSWSMETDDWCFRLEDGHIADYRKGGTWCFNYYGISYWTAEDCAKLREDYPRIWQEPGGRDLFWEFIPLVQCRDRYAVEVRPCRKQAIMEIDSYGELAQLDPSYRLD